MPLYEFRCPECGHTWEALRPIGRDGADLACPTCGRTGPEKLLSTFAARGGGHAPSGCGSTGFG